MLYHDMTYHLLTPLDYLWVSRIQHQSPSLPYRSPRVLSNKSKFSEISVKKKMEYASICMEISRSKWYTSRNFVSIEQCFSFFLLIIPLVNWLFGLAKWKANLPDKIDFFLAFLCFGFNKNLAHFLFHMSLPMVPLTRKWNPSN